MYFIVAIALLVCLLVYFRIADRYNIIDKPNHRSSHSAITIRGGGIVFPVAAILYSILFYNTSAALLAGLLLISLISFWDDVNNLPNKVRLLVHLLSVTALLWSAGLFQMWPLWLIPIAYVLIIGGINAYNFMDGINGITGFYSLIVLISLLYMNEEVLAFTDEAFIICPILACLVFLFFNFRKKAKCFAGDVGSVSIGFWIISLLLMVMIRTKNLEYIFFLAVYGVDTVLTIGHRLLLRQNIFEAHRLHVYQLLANERKISHLTVAILYGLLQGVVNIGVLFTDYDFLTTAVFVLTPLVIGYIALKTSMMEKTSLG